MKGAAWHLGVESEVQGRPRDWHHGDVDGTHNQGEFTMSYHFDAIRATMDERLREAEKDRLVRALRLKDRAERTTQRARQALANLTA